MKLEFVATIPLIDILYSSPTSVVPLNKDSELLDLASHMYPYKVEGISCVVLLETLRLRAFGATRAPRPDPKEHNATRTTSFHILS